jgi:spore germination protein YaaH
MGKIVISGIFGLVMGLFVGYLLIFYTPLFSKEKKEHYISPLLSPRPQVIGFLPYWLVGSAQNDYSDFITTLTYFGLTAGEDGHLVKMANEQEQEPGWTALQSDKLSTMLEIAKKKRLQLSLLVFSGDKDAINTMVSNPDEHAQNLVSDVIPVMKKYGFTDLNLDIESTVGASESARKNFTVRQSGKAESGERENRFVNIGDNRR